MNNNQFYQEVPFYINNFENRKAPFGGFDKPRPNNNFFIPFILGGLTYRIFNNRPVYPPYYYPYYPPYYYPYPY
ncbi:MAG: hypothetical protein RSE91_01570 [Bacilli bacterium]